MNLTRALGDEVGEQGKYQGHNSERSGRKRELAERQNKETPVDDEGESLSS
jgi:hypothetical protein